MFSDFLLPLRDLQSRCNQPLWQAGMVPGHRMTQRAAGLASLLHWNYVRAAYATNAKQSVSKSIWEFTR